MCGRDGFIKLQVHWETELTIPFDWSYDPNKQPLKVIKQGFDVYAGINVYVVKDGNYCDGVNTFKLIKNSLVFAESHFLQEVECQS